MLAALFLLAYSVAAQNSSGRQPRLPEERFKSGATTLHTFAPVAEAARRSVVKFSLDGPGSRHRCRRIRHHQGK